MADTFSTRFDQTRMLLVEPEWAGITDQMVADRNLIEGGNTVLSVDPLSGISTWQATFQFGLKSHAEMKAFATWIIQRQGRMESFWLPSWVNDFYLAVDYVSGTTSLVVSPCWIENLTLFFAADRGTAPILPWNLGLMIVQSNENRHFRGIAGFSIDGFGRPVFTLDQSIAATFVVGQVERISLLRRVRVDQDITEIGYDSDSTGRAQVSFAQVPFEGEDFRP